MRTAISFNPSHEAHAEAGHIERPERLHAIRALLQKSDVLSAKATLEPVPAALEDVLLVHPRGYYDRLEAAVQAGGARLDPDTYAKTRSLDVAMEGLGGVLSATKAVLEAQFDNSFALVRPPGHHARPDEAMGFCLLANVAIAARWAQAHYDVDRVLIVDFDVHHGNGTQEIFYEDPNVMYMSTHQWPFYPGTGALEETGRGAGAGTTLNVPLPANTGDTDILNVFNVILTPRALAFNPDLVIVSAGYDAHWMDPIGGLNLTVNGFTDVMRAILGWANTCAGNRLVAVLEGGYNTDALAHGVLATLRLLQDPDARPADPFGPSPRKDADLSDHLDAMMAFHLNTD